MNTLLSISGLYKNIGGEAILRDINLELKSGQILGLIGPNGAGKSTCLNSILGLTDYHGEISVLGLSPQKDRAKMLERVAYISDVAVLPKWATAKQLIAYMKGVHPNFSPDKALHFLEQTKIKPSAKISSLSKGMVTQLHLALTLAVDADILILDEPTIGLDIMTRREFYNHLLEDFFNEDKAIIVTTHQVDEVANILTDVAFIKDGHLVFNENVEALNKRYQLVAVAGDKRAEAQTHSPLFSNSMMGVSSMLFENVDRDVLETFGKVSTPRLEDIFVGVMSMEVSK